MKKIISTFIAFLLATSLQAAIIRTTVNLPFENGTIKVEVVLNSDGNVATIGTGYNACIPQYAEGKMHIPSTVTHNNITYTVTAIAPVAFRFCTKLTEVEIDAGVITIGNYAFVGCLDMEAISLPSTVTTIGGGAFCKLPNLVAMKCAAVTPPTWKWYDVFQADGSNDGRHPDLKLYVPTGSESAYQAAKNDYSWTCMDTSTTPYTWGKTETRPQVGWGSYFDVIRSLEQWDVDHSISIYTVDDLIAFRNKVNDGTTYNNYVVKLEADLDLAGVTWTPIGRVTKDNDKYYDFYGTFDGQGHTISNLTVGNDDSYTSEDGHNEGLFGGTRNATVKNLIMENATIKGNYFVGAVIAHAQASTTVENVLVKNCYVTGRCFTGGIIGGAEDYNDGDCVLRMNGCVVEGGSVTSVFNVCYDGDNYFYTNHPSWGAAGGLIGFAQKGWFTNCANLQTKVTWSSAKVDDSSLIKEYIDCQVCRGALVGYQDKDVPTGQKSMAYCYAHLHSENSLTRKDYMNNGDLDPDRLYGSPRWLDPDTRWSRDTDKVAANSSEYELESMQLQKTLTTGNPGQWAFHGDELPWPAYFAYKAYGDLDPSWGYVVYLPYGVTINRPNYLTIDNNTSSQYDDEGNTYTTDSLILPRNIQGYDFQLPIGKVQITALNGVVNRRKLTATLNGTQEVTTVHPVYARDEDNMLILDPHGNPVQATNPDGSPKTESVTETASLYTPEGYTLYLPYTTTLTGNCKLYQPTAWDEATSTMTFTRLENNVVQAYKPYYVIVEEGEVNLSTGTTTVIGVEPTDNGVIHIDGGSVSLDYLGNINDRFLDPQEAYQYTLGENRWELATSSAIDINSWSAYFIANNQFGDVINMDFEDNTFINLAVSGHGESENSGWKFISSPIVGSIAPSDVENLEGTLLQGHEYNYDLFLYDQSADLPWKNYHNHDTEAAPFMLINGQGYLYATKTERTLSFRGTFNTAATKDVTLQNGFNLVGNPFNVPAYVNRSYYKMNAAGSDIEAVNEYTTNTIPVCTGIVVKATANNETVRFSQEPPVAMSHNNGSLQMTLTRPDLRSDAVQDKAIVSFNEGAELGKFIFNESHAKLYIPQNGEDYAIVFSEKNGVVPLNFKAKETGRYSITFNFEDMSGVRVQLVDKFENKTIDNPTTYTFVGSSADLSDRFTLVFTNVETDGVFAYQSGNSIIVSGEGELQVFDVTGRMVKTQQINGVETISTLTQGVYILRVNGKTQKIVIR